MKTAIWCVFGLLTVLWTAGAWVAAELMRWVAQLAASGAVADLAQAAARWPSPAWLGFWVDPAWIQGLQNMALWSLHALHDGLPLVGSVLGWLVPMVWLAWGLGIIVLLGLTALTLLLRARFAQSVHALRSEGVRS